MFQITSRNKAFIMLHHSKKNEKQYLKYIVKHALAMNSVLSQNVLDRC